MRNFDNIIIGGGISGLMLAHSLYRRGHSVHLLEARENLGGSWRSPHLTFIPATNDNLALLKSLDPVLSGGLRVQVVEHRPQIFAAGEWRPFVGFGENEVDAMAVLAPLSSGFEATVEPDFTQIVRGLAEPLPFSSHTLNEVTGLRIVNKQVEQITVNGEHHLHGDRVYYTGSVAQLNQLLAPDVISNKLRTRLGKLTSWTSVTLEMTHPEPLLEHNHICLFESGAKEFGPVVGRCLGNVSLWMTLVSAEREDEHEHIGQCLRHIKRQLTRAWPHYAETAHNERIFLHPQAHGLGLPWLAKENWRLPEIDNLYLANGILSATTVPLGAWEIAQVLSNDLMVASDNSPVLTQGP